MIPGAGAVNAQPSGPMGIARPEVDAALDGKGAGASPGSLVLVPHLLEALRRRWRVWTITAALGLIAAAAFSAAFPPRHSATTVVLVRHDAIRSDPARAIETDVELARSKVVAQRAIDDRGLRLSTSQLLLDSEASLLTNDLVRIVAKGPTAGEAIRRASALAQAFLEFRREVLERQAQSAVAALEERRAALNSELSQINSDIAQAASVGGDQTNASGTQRLGDLLGRRAGLNAEEADIRRRIDDAVIGTKLIVNGSGVVDPASQDDRSPLLALAANIGAGIFCGLALGIGWVVAQAVASDRVRTPHDVMSAVATPAVVSVPRPRVLVRRHRRRLRHRLARRPHGKSPGTRTRGRRRIRQLTDHLRRSLAPTGDGTRALVVLSVGSDRAAAVAVASLAVDLLNEGKNVLLADLSSRAVASGLFDWGGAKASTDRLPGPDASLRVSSAPFREGSTTRHPLPPREEADVVLTLATLHPALAPEHLAGWGTSAVVLATAGRSSTTTLRWARRMLHDAGLHLSSIVLLGGPRRDSSFAVDDDLPAERVEGGRHVLVVADDRYGGG